MNTLFLNEDNRTAAVARLAEDGTLPVHVGAAYANELVGGDIVSSRPQSDLATATTTYTVAEAATILNVAQSTVRRRVKKGDYTVTVAEDGVQRVTIPA